MKNYFIIVFTLFSIKLSAQNFIMNGKTPLMINPAFSGVNDYGRLTTTANMYRYSDNYQLNSYVGYDIYLSKLKGSVGFYNSNYILSNTNRTSNFAISYAYQNKINNKWNYSLGVNISFIEQVINWDNLIIYCFDTCPTGKEKYHRINFNLGGLLYSDKWFLGYALADVYIDNSGTSVPKSNINFGRSFFFKNNKDLSFTTGIYMSLYHNGWSYVDFQTIVNYKFMYLGAKVGETGFAFQAGTDLKRFKLSYSFQNSISVLVNTGQFQHEVALKVKLPKIKNRKTKTFNHLIF